MLRISWDDHLMVEALWLTRRSPDPSTKHGAIFVDDCHRPLSRGYNGFPRGSDDELMPTTRPEKYFCIIHAEENAVINAAKSLEGSHLYVTGQPCSRCWAKLIQIGVKRVVIGPIGSVMLDDMEARMTALLLKGRDIEIVQWQGDLEQIARDLAWLQQILGIGGKSAASEV